LSGSKSYGRGAAILSLGIGATGLITFAYFSLASYSLPKEEYGHITLLWSAVFITVSVLYRPVEQLLSRTIADRDARGVHGTEHLRIAATIQLALGVLFAVVALVLRDPIQNDLFGGSSTLYWVLLVSVLAYAASYFARGYLAGHRLFLLYGGLVLMEASSRCLFALAVAIGIAEGQSAVALGMAAAPIVSLAVVPPALARRLAPSAASPELDPALLDAAAREEPAAREPEFTLARGAGFAAAVLVIMLCEQTFLNAGPLLVKATEDSGGAALAGFTFNVLLIARAPLQLFQAIQTSILPHLTRLRASGESDPFRRSVNLTLVAIAGFAGCVALVMLVAGPQVMDLLFGGDFDYERGGLVLVAIGMGLYLSAATLNQALLAHGMAAHASACWVTAAAGFVLFLLLADFDDRVLQVEVAFVAAAALLSAALYALYRHVRTATLKGDGGRRTRPCRAG
jgi:O-antigen/teichoic acid export membrane protein